MTDDRETIFENSPVLGAFIDVYPSNRLRLLLTSGIILGAVWFVTTVGLWNVEDNLAALITVGIIGVSTWAVAWYMAHFWNREVVLYKDGFSYRRGSYAAEIRFDDVRSIRLRAERVAYFGGLIRRTIFRITIHTLLDEIIVLNNNYRKMEELSLRLDAAITRSLHTRVATYLTNHGEVAFGESLVMIPDGLRDSHGDVLQWAKFGGFTVQGGVLVLQRGDGSAWLSLPLSAVDNLRLLRDMLEERMESAR